ncbi:DUF421 domain-containing protein [Acetobacteraceae bacterium]|nr:DUF421 domain-containing protein [Acetobacteraceae bacterium]
MFHLLNPAELHAILHVVVRESERYLLLFLELTTGFAIVMSYLRYTGRTQFSQMNAIDAIGNFILGGLLGGIFSDSVGFIDYLMSLILSVGILCVLNYLYLHSDFFHKATIGDPIPVIKDGRFIMRSFLANNSKVDILNVISQLNLQGIFSFSDVAYAQMEPDGSITATLDKSRVPAIVVIYAGGVRLEVLEHINKTEQDLLEDMRKNNIENLNDVFLGEYSKGTFRYICRNGRSYPTHDPATQLPNSFSI